MKDYNRIDERYEDGAYDDCKSKEDIESLLNIIDELYTAPNVPVKEIYGICEAVLANTKRDFVKQYFFNYGIMLDEDDSYALLIAAEGCINHPYVEAIKVLKWINEEVEN